MVPCNNFAAFYNHISSTYVNSRTLNYYEQGQWHAISMQDFTQEVKDLTLGLIASGIKRGDCIGLMALPSPRWTVINLAVILTGATLIPLFPNLSEENFIYEATQTDMKKIFIERPTPISIFDRHREQFSLVIEMAPNAQDETSIPYQQIIDRGRTYDEECPKAFSQLLKEIHDDDLAAIIYTSATTGTPKGVELTHQNLLRHLSDVPIQLIPLETRYLSILPLAHIFGFSLNLTLLGHGACIYYMNDVKNLRNACHEVHPTIMVVVPRLLEKLYAKMQAAVQTAGFMKRHLGQWAFDLANQDSDSLIKYLMHPLVDTIVYSHLRDALGGSVEVVISGGAALNPHLNHFFQEIGVPIYEGWGLTEACPITVNTPAKNKIGTVGPPFKHISIKTTPEGEVLVKGSLVMRGYYKEPELTAQVLDQDGWLHTGDKGEIDEDGYLKLQGRLKELYKTSTGEYVAPVPIEQLICQAPLIEIAMVIADGRKFASCLLFPNKEVLDSLKAAHQAQNLSDDEFLNSEFVRGEMDKLFESLNKHLNHWEQIHAYCFIPHPPSIEAGEMTPSMKLRREVIMNKYQHLIDAMYPQEAKT